MNTTPVALAGFGAVGRTLAGRLRDLPHHRLAAVSARDTDRASSRLAELGFNGVPVTSIGALAEHADIVVECAPAALLPNIAEPVLKAGKTVVVLSSGALLENWDLVDLARDNGGRILVPTGALLGLDAVQAAAMGTIESVQMTTRKPPAGLVGAPHLERENISLDGLTEPKLVFEGSVREAFAGFPANLNVAVALSLAGIGPDRTTISVWADPSVTRNEHDIEVVADSATLRFEIENVPSSNAKTGQLTALSVLALLRKLSSPLRIGT